MITGNIFLTICCAIYLIWWAVAFNPKRTFPLAPKVALFFPTLAIGLIGCGYVIYGITQTEAMQIIPNWVICLFGVGIYAFLLYLTSRVLHRHVTTELILIVGWMTLELCLVNTLSTKPLTASIIIVCTVFILISAAIGLVCYLAYYQLKPMSAFYVGTIPLVLFALCMGGITILVGF